MSMIQHIIDELSELDDNEFNIVYNSVIEEKKRRYKGYVIP